MTHVVRRDEIINLEKDTNLKMEIRSNGELAFSPGDAEPFRRLRNANQREEAEEDSIASVRDDRKMRSPGERSIDPSVVFRIPIFDSDDEDETVDSGSSHSPQLHVEEDDDERRREPTTVEPSPKRRRTTSDVSTVAPRKHPHLTLSEESIVESRFGGIEMLRKRYACAKIVNDYFVANPVAPPKSGTSTVDVRKEKTWREVARESVASMDTPECSEYRSASTKVIAARLAFVNAELALASAERTLDIERIPPVALAPGSVARLKALVLQSRENKSSLRVRIRQSELGTLSDKISERLKSSIYGYIDMCFGVRDDLRGLFSADPQNRAIYLVETDGLPCAVMYPDRDEMYVRALLDYNGDLDLLVCTLVYRVAPALSSVVAPEKSFANKRP